MSALLFVAYASSAVCEFTPAALIDLLDVSRRNNAREALTGLLLHRGGNFMQALEGPEDAVRATMLRIARDVRHRSIVTLVEEWREERVFGEWAMGFDEVARLDEGHPGASAYLTGGADGRHVSSIEDGEHDVFEFFRSFRDHIR